MSEPTTEPAATGAEAVTSEGELLSDDYGRLIPLHMGLATADSVGRDFHLRLMHEIMDVLHAIERNPEFRVAHEAEMERRRLHPTPDELVAQERGRAAVERFLKAREERRARESADASSG